jgi:hypothetical protein
MARTIDHLSRDGRHLSEGTTWLAVAGVVGALPAVARQFSRGVGPPKNKRDVLVQPAMTIRNGQNPPDKVAVREALRRRRASRDDG